MALPKRSRLDFKHGCMTRIKEILIQGLNVGSVMFEPDWLLTSGPELRNAGVISRRRRVFRLSVLRLAKILPHQTTSAPPLTRGTRSPISSCQKIRESACKKIGCLTHACALHVSHCNRFGTEKNYRKEERILCRHVTCPPLVSHPPTASFAPIKHNVETGGSSWAPSTGLEKAHALDYNS